MKRNFGADKGALVNYENNMKKNIIEISALFVSTF